MAYVITEPCHDCKDTACVEVCPCDCIHEGTLERDGRTYDMLFIDPAECIDFGMCEPECPVSAIFMDVDVPVQWNHFVQMNAEFYQKSR